MKSKSFNHFVVAGVVSMAAAGLVTVNGSSLAQATRDGGAASGNAPSMHRFFSAPGVRTQEENTGVTDARQLPPFLRNSAQNHNTEGEQGGGARGGHIIMDGPMPFDGNRRGNGVGGSGGERPDPKAVEMRKLQSQLTKLQKALSEIDRMFAQLDERRAALEQKQSKIQEQIVKVEEKISALSAPSAE